ncbi:hypothetical protein GCM10027098_37810 [Bowmanella dokdonensis]
MVNTLILARLLSPEDFGIVAMASIFINMLMAMTEAGIHLYVIRHKEDDNRIYNSAWTANLIQALVVALLMLLLAPYVADFFNQQALVEIIYCLALVRLLEGAKNIGIFIAQKQLNFRLDFKLSFYTKISSVIVTVALGFWLRSYWALVWGQVLSAIVGLVLSYTMFSYRPALSLYKWRDILRYSASTLPFSIGGFINGQADVIIVGRMATADFLGKYQMGLNLAGMFTRELMMPVVRGLLPNFAIVKETAEGKKFLAFAITGAVYVFVPLGVGLNAVAPEFVATLLGDKWLSVTPILAWFSLYTMMTGIMMFLGGQFLIVMGREKLSNRLVWMRSVILFSTIFLTLYLSDYHALPRSLFLSACVALPIVLLVVTRVLAFNLAQLLLQWIPPVLSALAMWMLIRWLPWPEWPMAIMLIVKVLAGALCYGVCVAVFYLLRGMPSDSLEAFLIRKLMPAR